MHISNPSASFVRPANTTAYASGNLIANSTIAGSVVPLTFTLGNSFGPGSFRMSRVRISKTGASVTNASFRLHLYQSSPVASNGDGGAWLTTNAIDWLGNIDVTSMLEFADGCAGTGSVAAGSEMFLKLTSGAALYGLLEARAAYTPISGEMFTVTLEEVDAF